MAPRETSAPTDSPATGAGAGASAPTRPRAAVPSVRPALIVVAIAAVLVLLFGIGAALVGSSRPKASPHPLHVRGATLAAEPAGRSLQAIETRGTPPSDVLGAVVVPKGASRTGAAKWNGATQFSGTVDYAVPASQAAVVDFFSSELKARGWSTPDVTAARSPKGATEVLAQRGSSDGWYWEIGIVVSPTKFAGGAGSGTGTSATGSGSAGNRTAFTLELYEAPDVQ
ncbi:MAG: hypothetical protein ACRDWE_05405 [Acidimicrobiales bacterium]